MERTRYSWLATRRLQGCTPSRRLLGLPVSLLLEATSVEELDDGGGRDGLVGDDDLVLVLVFDGLEQVQLHARGSGASPGSSALSAGRIGEISCAAGDFMPASVLEPLKRRSSHEVTSFRGARPFSLGAL